MERLYLIRNFGDHLGFDPATQALKVDVLDPTRAVTRLDQWVVASVVVAPTESTESLCRILHSHVFTIVYYRVNVFVWLLNFSDLRVGFQRRARIFTLCFDQNPVIMNFGLFEILVNFLNRRCHLEVGVLLL